jgi:hypothetical protein
MSELTLSALIKAQTNPFGSDELSYFSDVTIIGDAFYDDVVFDVAGIEAILEVKPDSRNALLWLFPIQPIAIGTEFSVVWEPHYFETNALPLVGLDSKLKFEGTEENPESNSNAIAPAIPHTLLPEFVEKPDLFLAMEQGRKAEPLEVYEFEYGYFHKEMENKQVFRFTSGNEPIRFKHFAEGEFFAPEVIRRDELQHTNDIAKVTLTLTVQKNNPVAAMFIPGTPAFPIAVRVYKAYTEVAGGVAMQGNTITDYLVIFTGRVSTVTFSGMEARITCDPIYSAVKRQGLKRRYEPSCSHALYQTSCDVNRDNYKTTITNATFNKYGSKIKVPESNTTFHALPKDTRNSQGIISSTVTVETVASGEEVFRYVPNTGYFTGGMVKLADGTFHMILNHKAAAGQQDGELVLMRHVVLDDDTKSKVLNSDGTIKNLEIYPGCDRTSGTCLTKFNNLVNFGGFPFMPDTNPFVGTHVPQGG